MDVEHLEIALALWDYVEESTRIIFAARTGDRVADRILGALLPGERMSVEELRREIFSGHVGSADLLTALKTLSDLGMVTVERDDTTGGRPRIVVGRADPARITDGHEATNAAA